MNDQQLAEELIRRGIIGSEELQLMSIGQVLVKRGIIGSEELNQGLSVFEIVKRRGLI